MAQGIACLCGGCKSCKRKDYMRQYNQRYHAANRTRLIDASRRWKQKNRSRANELNAESALRQKRRCFALYGSRCNRCGFEDERALQIDHINGPGDDRGSIYRGGQKLYAAILRGDRARDNHQLLCANCNWIKRYENEECKRA
jgi:hypothetical protein